MDLCYVVMNLTANKCSDYDTVHRYLLTDTYFTFAVGDLLSYNRPTLRPIC